MSSIESKPVLHCLVSSYSWWRTNAHQLMWYVDYFPKACMSHRLEHVPLKKIINTCRESHLCQYFLPEIKDSQFGKCWDLALKRFERQSYEQTAKTKMAWKITAIPLTGLGPGQSYSRDTLYKLKLHLKQAINRYNQKQYKSGISEKNLTS